VAIIFFSQKIRNNAVLDVFVVDLHMNCIRLFDHIYHGDCHGRQSVSTERDQVGRPTSVDMLVGHTKVILAGLLTTANPLHAVLPSLDIALQEDPSVAEEIMLGKIGGVFGMGAFLIHAYEALGKFNVPCPLAAG
jgi:hypothetical protein